MKRFMVGTRHGLAVFSTLVILTAATTSTRFAPVAHGEMPPAASPNEVIWFDDFETGWRHARRLGRPMVIFITTRHCRYCNVMKRRTLTDGSIVRRIRDSFVAVELTPDRNSQTLRRIRVPAYPHDPDRPSRRTRHRSPDRIPAAGRDVPLAGTGLDRKRSPDRRSMSRAGDGESSVAVFPPFCHVREAAGKAAAGGEKTAVAGRSGGARLG